MFFYTLKAILSTSYHYQKNRITIISLSLKIEAQK